MLKTKTKVLGSPWVLAGVLAVTLGVTNNAAAQVVKKSSSGVCHCPGGQFYERTTNFTEFETIEACLDSGGREPQRGQGDCSIASARAAPDRPPRTDNAPAGVVKKSSSGICHCPGGQFYDRTTNFTEFETIEACLDSGGREPQRGQGDCSAASPSSDSTSMLLPDRYDRRAFGGWSDEDGDCQNTRHEHLIARSAGPVELSEDGCQVLRGRWRDPYTGNIHVSAPEIEIDHVVPLFYAWERGANRWEPETQRRFANDSANLLPVGAMVNRSKGAAGPLEWLPPSEAFACEYLLRFARVVDRYDLNLRSEEVAALEQLTAQKCD